MNQVVVGVPVHQGISIQVYLIDQTNSTAGRDKRVAETVSITRDAAQS
jgi:hypothetical protein